MIYVNNASIIDNGKAILIDLETDLEVDRIINLTLWVNENFKDYSKTIDISHYIDGSTNKELIKINALDLDLISFQGLIYIEAEDNSDTEENCSDCTNTKLIILTNFNKFYLCMVKELNKVHLDSCIKEGSNCCDIKNFDKVILMQNIIEGIKLNLKVGRYNVATEYMKKLNKLCKNCKDNNHRDTSHCYSCN